MHIHEANSGRVSTENFLIPSVISRERAAGSRRPRDRRFYDISYLGWQNAVVHDETVQRVSDWRKLKTITREVVITHLDCSKLWSQGWSGKKNLSRGFAIRSFFLLKQKSLLCDFILSPNNFNSRACTRAFITSIPPSSIRNINGSPASGIFVKLCVALGYLRGDMPAWE